MPKRIRLRRIKGWRKPEGARVVTRATVFGNPWAVDVDEAFRWPKSPIGWRSAHRIAEGLLSAEAAVEQFRAWIDGYAIPRHMRPEHLTREGRRACWDALSARRAIIWNRLPELSGLDLACSCRLDAPCHADVLLELAKKGRR